MSLAMIHRGGLALFELGTTISVEKRYLITEVWLSLMQELGVPLPK